MSLKCSDVRAIALDSVSSVAEENRSFFSVCGGHP